MARRKTPGPTHSTHTRAAQSGFTLIELLVTLVVLGIVASIAVVSVMTAFDKAKQRATMADMRTVSKALEVYMIDVGRLPDDSGGLEPLRDVLRPYQTNVLPVRDHWGHDYVYTRNGLTGDYTVASYGKDGIDGDDITLADRFDFDKDIVLINGQFVAAPE